MRKAEGRKQKAEGSVRKESLRNISRGADPAGLPGTSTEIADLEGLRQPGEASGGQFTIHPSPFRIDTPAITLLPYQRRWVEDDAPLKIVVKARQIGYSFAATLRAVLRCLERKTTWVFLSKGERQSRLLMEKVAEHIRSAGVVARAMESTFFEGTLLKQLETRFPNGSVIYGLPANPDTARGYSGNVTLDEFAFHADADKIYAALFPTITRGYSLEVISTPNGQQGKFYELAKTAGLVDAVTGNREPGTGITATAASLSSVPGSRLPVPWSAHQCDIYDALRQGLKIDLALLRAGCGDETAWQQEFCCQFVSTAENFFPLDLLAACLSAEASADTPPRLLASGTGTGNREPGTEGRESVTANRETTTEGTGSAFPVPDSRFPVPEFFLGLDIGRRHDRTVFWVDEVQHSKLETGNSKLEIPNWKIDQGETNFDSRSQSAIGNHQSSISIARLVRTLENVPFDDQLAVARELLALEDAHGQPLIRRACIDATGIGAPLAESLAREFGPRVEPVVFTAAVKEDLAYRTKRRMEQRRSLLPDTREIRRAFSAVKRLVTPSGNLRFDAARTEAGHADEFWAKALADLAADDSSGRAASLADAFLAEGAPIVSPLAFGEMEMSWEALETL